MIKFHYDRPLAIAMWDFSWLERRWPGAGYEDWDQVLGELKERGYDAVRIDAYPHLLAADGSGSWTLKPEWNQQVWGAPALIEVDHIQDNLLSFLRCCKKRGIVVALSSWFREDLNNVRLSIKTPSDLAMVWNKTLDAIRRADLLDTILYVDLSNEYPHPAWTPYLVNASGMETPSRFHPECVRWMRESLGELRTAYPEIDFTFSEVCLDDETIEREPITAEHYGLDQKETDFLDIVEMHIWFTHFTDFYEKVGYRFDRFTSESYENLQKNGEQYYRSNPEYFKDRLKAGIHMIADWSNKRKVPMITTECWGPVDYKDWPLLNWGWVKELCEVGTIEASRTGRWAAIATSNFCAPQFAGMWRDVEWHRRLTDQIHRGRLPKEIRE